LSPAVHSIGGKKKKKKKLLTSPFFRRTATGVGGKEEERGYDLGYIFGEERKQLKLLTLNPYVGSRREVIA